MNKLVIFTVLATCVFSTAFTKQKKCLTDKYNTPITQVVSLTDLNEATVKNLFEEGNSDMAIRCAPGTNLPLRCLGDFKFFSVQFDPNLTIRLEKECYIRVIKRKKSLIPYISFDLTTWEKLSSYLHGKVNPSFGIEDESFISVKTALEEKQ